MVGLKLPINFLSENLLFQKYDKIWTNKLCCLAFDDHFYAHLIADFMEAEEKSFLIFIFDNQKMLIF